MKKTFLALCSIAVLLYACKDEDVITNLDLVSTQATEDHLIVEQIFSDIVRIVEKGFIQNGTNNLYPSYNLINSVFSDIDTMIISFGDGDEVPFEGKIISGEITVTYNGNYRDSLTVITSTFDNYNVNNNLVQGEIVIKNQGRNNIGNLCFKIDVNNSSVNTPLNGTINWESNRVREWVSGQNTYSDISDDIYKISGTAIGNGVNGKDFTMEITSPLELDLSCLPFSSCIIKSGTAKISPNGYEDRIINYGDSLCDCNFDISINGTNYPIVVN